MNLNVTATIVFVILFLLVSWLGFVAAHWRKADLNQLHEWGLGGRRFGTVVTWFLLGGDLYTAYTFIAVPALVFGAGAMGFFAVAYAILIYPFLYLIYPRLWAIARERGHVTAADFVRDRFDSRLLALAVALTGIVATMPYIALQLIGMEVVIGALGFPTNGFAGHLPLIIAFIVLAAFTYTSGLRAPALIAVVKDMLIFITIFAAVVIIPAKLGGYGAIFAAVPPEKLILPPATADNFGKLSAYAGARMLYYRPPNRFTAEFLGRANLLPVQIVAADADTGAVSVRLGASIVSAFLPPGTVIGGQALLCLRPHDLKLQPSTLHSNAVEGTLQSLHWQGETQTLSLETAAGEIRVITTPLHQPPESGSKVVAYFAPADAVVRQPSRQN